MDSHPTKSQAIQICENSLPVVLRESLTVGVPDNKAPLLQELLDILYTQFQCTVEMHESVIIAKLQVVQEDSESPTNYTVEDIWEKIQVVLQLVADLYIDMCTSASEKGNSNYPTSGDESVAGSGLSDLNSYFVKKKVGLSAAVGSGFGKAKKFPLFRFDSSSHAMSLNAYLREQKEAMREKTELTSDALDTIDIERILGFLGR